MKTYKQLADELGVSKDQVKYRARLLPGEYLVKENGITYIKSEGISQIIDHVKGKLTHVQTRDGNVLTPTLINQLEVKDRQITELTASNRELTAALENTTASLRAAQALHAGTMKHLADNESKPRPGFFSRFFSSDVTKSKTEAQGVNE